MLRIRGCLKKEGVEGSPHAVAKMEEVGGSAPGGLGDESEVCHLPQRWSVVAAVARLSFIRITKEGCRLDVMLRHMRNVHANVKDTDPLKPLDIFSSMTLVSCHDGTPRSPSGQWACPSGTPGKMRI